MATFYRRPWMPLRGSGVARQSRTRENASLPAPRARGDETRLPKNLLASTAALDIAVFVVPSPLPLELL